ncbi:MAG: hypothetical protein ACOYJI_07580 [Anaerovoracaceae bacterium]|jgi:hypothetical protein
MIRGSLEPDSEISDAEAAGSEPPWARGVRKIADKAVTRRVVPKAARINVK